MHARIYLELVKLVHVNVQCEQYSNANILPWSGLSFPFRNLDCLDMKDKRYQINLNDALQIFKA